MEVVQKPCEADLGFAVEVSLPGISTALSYGVPTQFSSVDIGHEVLVELGRRQVHGWVTRKLSYEEALESLKASKQQAPQPESDQLTLFTHKAPTQSRALKQILSCSPAFPAQQLPLFQWIAQYYGDSLFDVIDSAIPKRVNWKSEKYCLPTERAKSCSPAELESELSRSPAQLELLTQILLNQTLPYSEVVKSAPSARTGIAALEKKGFVQLITEEEFTDFASEREIATETPNREGPKLTERQRLVVEKLSEQLKEKRFNPTLLFGVTGSGKTEVYIQLIEEALRDGGSALVIVPEIALTPQLFDLFERRLSVKPALLHSQVLPSSRWRSWEQMRQGKIRVAIGARSAVFAPLENLRLVIVDEEHESSYKQSDGLRYHGRDVAVMRAKFEEALVVLGSATPSFETLVNVQRKRYSLAELPERATARPLPSLEIVDLNTIRRSEMITENISPPLHDAIEATLSAGGQIVILYNRRGFSSYLQCVTCNEVVLCPNCSVAMTHHKGSARLLCHYCNESSPPPSHCKFCRDPHTFRFETEEAELPKEVQEMGTLVARGSGTERVVEDLALLYPKAVTVRLDRDTATHRESYREILGKMRSGEAQILVGTQMIAKGHDLPGVTLVGIIDADVGLHSPDFRSSERTFQLITQAAGRAGRGSEPGKVIVQTREPNHPTIVATTTGRFTAFARFELDYRKKLNYPPWGKLLRLIVSSTDAQDAFRAAELVRTAVDEVVEILSKELNATTDSESPSTASKTLTVLGPAPAPHERLRGRYRWHILVKAPSAKILSSLAARLNGWKTTVRDIKDFRLIIDIDPVDML